ncbi:MAG: putative rane-bound dehydrogenase [Verrucomicrobiales bacterium]|nr:putative rane-bound dehydrogenase [Verrucomicrobiales bacterium]
MKKTLFRGISLFVAASFSLQGAQFKFGDQTLTVPDGFEIELVTSTNVVKRPVSMDYDEQGRLYVTESAGSSEKVGVQLEKKLDRILRLEDTDGDGKFDKSTVFADKLMFPEGCLWFDGSLYVSSVPSIWKLTDTDGDGVADKREEWHAGKTMGGCANDLHGPYLGPDGFIYWCKGGFQEQSYEINGKPWVSKAAHIFRARPDHTRLEPVMTGGMDNPVGLAFSPTGERFVAGTFFEPHIPGQRDGVIHAIYGGVYGKPHPDVLDGFAKTGELMPVMVHLGPAASATVISYKSEVFGKEFKDNLFVGNFNLHSVTRHILTPDGATFKPTDSVFLSCDHPDFHPTCLLEDADGSLLVIDTGGWYKVCCPTSQLYKPEVFGAIYRIRRKGAPKIEDPRGLKIDWAKSTPDQLAKFLDDNRPYVVEKALQRFAKLDSVAIPTLKKALKDNNSMETRRNAIWALTRIDHADARGAIRDAFFRDDINYYVRSDDSVMRAAMHSVGLWRDMKAIDALAHGQSEEHAGLTDPLIAALASNGAAMRREAAEVWGRVAQDKPFAVRHLLSSAADSFRLKNKNDRVLDHSFIYALMELNDPRTTAEGLTNSPSAQRIALVALDQMDNGGLKPEQVTPFLLSTNTQLKEAAAWVVSHHPEWGDVLAGFFRDALAKKEFSPAAQNELAKQLSELASNGSVQELITKALDSKATEIIALRAMAWAGLSKAPAAWAPGIVKILAGTDAPLIKQAVTTAKNLSFEKKPQELVDALLRIANDNSAPAENRLNALAAVHGQISVDAPLFAFLTAHLDPKGPVLIRGAATSALIRVKLSEEQLLSLTDSLKTSGPLEVSKLLGAFERSTNEALGLKVVATLKEAKALKSVRGETLKQHLGKYPAAVQVKLDELIATLNVDAGKQAAHINDLLASLKDGDIRRGQLLFNSPKTACSSCHAIGYGGGHVGPDLTKIGQVRTERDLLEAIVYPSASFVRSFEPMIVTTKDEDYSGIVKKDNADEVVLVTGPNAESRIARADITEMRPGNVSVMPQGLDEQLSKQEMADLIAFLKAVRW